MQRNEVSTDPFAMTCPACGGEFRDLAYISRCPLCLEKLQIVPDSPKGSAKRKKGPKRTKRKRVRAPSISGKYRKGKLQTVAERDGWTCALCRRPVDPKAPPGDLGFATLDHIIPRSKGGPNANTNLQLAHYSCNTRRGNGSLP